jgi:hypothetical protein
LAGVASTARGAPVLKEHQVSEIIEAEIAKNCDRTGGTVTRCSSFSKIYSARTLRKRDRTSSGQTIVYASSVGRERNDATIYSLQPELIPVFICLQ